MSESAWKKHKHALIGLSGILIVACLGVWLTVFIIEQVNEPLQKTTELAEWFRDNEGYVLAQGRPVEGSNITDYSFSIAIFWVMLQHSENKVLLRESCTLYNLYTFNGSAHWIKFDVYRYLKG